MLKLYWLATTVTDRSRTLAAPTLSIYSPSSANILKCENEIKDKLSKREESNLDLAKQVMKGLSFSLAINFYKLVSGF